MKIDFYVLMDLNKQNRLRFVCELLNKYYNEQAMIFVHTASIKEAEYFDQLLWTYRDDSFIPHHLDHDKTDQTCTTPIHIGEKVPLTYFQGMMINLNPELFIPPSSVCSYLVEIVFPEVNMQQLARERYKHYQSQGHELTTYKIKANSL